MLILDGGGREREINRLLSLHTPTGVKPTTYICVLNRDRTCNLLLYGTMLQPMSHPARMRILFKNSAICLLINKSVYSKLELKTSCNALQLEDRDSARTSVTVTLSDSCSPFPTFLASCVKQFPLWDIVTKLPLYTGCRCGTFLDITLFT